MEGEMRVLVIQQKARSSEATVFSTLLSALQQGGETQKKAVFQVLQFDNDDMLAYGEQLGLLPGVQVVSAHIGGSLGLGSAKRRVKKILVLGRLLLSLPKMVASSRAFRPDVIYTSQQRWDVRIGIMLSVLLRRPHVIHLHYLPGAWLGKEVTWRLKHCARVIGISEYIYRRAVEAGVPSERVVAIRNVLSADAMRVDISPAEARKRLCEELQIPVTDLLVGMTARLNRTKGQRELVRAMESLLADREMPCRLILVGLEDDPSETYAQEIIQFARDKGILDRIHWLGWRSDIPVLLRAFDVFAHPSFEEPCGLAVLEALLAGLPTVVWDEGGPVELVRDGQTGFRVETGNSEALTLALRRLCSDGMLRETMRRNALADVPRLTDTQAAAQRFYAVLADVVKSSVVQLERPGRQEKRGLRV